MVVVKKRVRVAIDYNRINNALIRAYNKEWKPEAFEAFQRHVRSKRTGMLHEAMYIAFARADSPDDLRDRRIWDALCKVNEGFIMSFVRQAIRRRALNESVAADLFQEGCVGIGIALRKYDPARKKSFSKYAWNWVQARVTRSSEDSYYRTAQRLPAYQIGWLQKVNAVDRWLAGRLGRSPTTEELIEQILSERWVNGRSVVTRDQVCVWVDLGARTLLSLNAPNQEGSTAERWISDRKTFSPETLTIMRDAQLEMQGHLEAMRSLILGKYGERGWLIFQLRSGIFGIETKTLERIAADERVGVTRERVRQLEIACYRLIQKRLGIARDEVKRYISLIEEIDRYTSHRW